ncbi:MAG: glycosyltransferase family 39 protein [Patescibacteria group bacterium]
MTINLNKKGWSLFLLAVIVVTAVFFRFWHLTGNDLYSDDALYSFRALGWFDYLGGGQTTPVQWFGSVPGWARLSFHDAPPLVLAIQNIFFKFLGPNVLAARLPFALAGLGAVLLLYFLVKKSKNRGPALLAAFLLGISSLATWASRVGYLEGVEVFFIVLSVFFLANFLAGGKKYNLYWWGITIGLSLLCKYTAIFLLPAAILYLLIWRRSAFKTKELWLALVLFLAVLTPIIIYNVNVFQTRGHFDAALSSMVGLHPEDFKTVASRGLSLNWWQNLLSLPKDALFTTTSFPIFLLLIISFVYLLVKVVRKKGDYLENFIFINLVMVLAMFAFVGAGPRFFSIVMPFLSLVLALFISDIWRWLRQKEFLVVQKIMILILLLAFVGEIVYNINTNLSVKSAGWPNISYSSARFYNLGFNQLDAYLQNDVLTPLPAPLRLTALNDIFLNPEDIKGARLVLTDERINWFAYSWYLQKYSFFYHLPVVSFYDVLNLTVPNKLDPMEFLKNSGAKDIYYILALDDSVLDPVKKENSNLGYAMKLLGDKLQERGADVKEIKNHNNLAVFKIYHLKNN